MKRSRQWFQAALRCICCFGLILSTTLSRAETNALSAAELKKLSLDELMNQEVTLITRRPEKLSESPSAVQVISGEDIRRSGATSLPEALRLASLVEVETERADAEAERADAEAERANRLAAELEALKSRK